MRPHKIKSVCAGKLPVATVLPCIIYRAPLTKPCKPPCCGHPATCTENLYGKPAQQSSHPPRPQPQTLARSLPPTTRSGVPGSPPRTLVTVLVPVVAAGRPRRRRRRRRNSRTALLLRRRRLLLRLLLILRVHVQHVLFRGYYRHSVEADGQRGVLPQEGQQRATHTGLGLQGRGR